MSLAPRAGRDKDSEGNLLWVIGSMPPAGQREYAMGVARLLGRRLAVEGVTVVAGESDLLRILSDEYRGNTRLDDFARCVTVHGSLRTGGGQVFDWLFGRRPSVAFVIGGGKHGRSAEEVQVAATMGARIGSFRRSGGVAASGSVAHASWNHSDPANAVLAAMSWRMS